MLVVTDGYNCLPLYIRTRLWRQGIFSHRELPYQRPSTSMTTSSCTIRVI
ncbi:hypothetical protein A2U01_0047732 [Trifolium medium]|uniref:Uncharacterized protein n=1 Tax=Trifolium medium TaxID=97028 RepID=A0A392QSN1_9FABA|nr:hypothetical protein [Trifolium medium]